MLSEQSVGVLRDLSCAALKKRRHVENMHKINSAVHNRVIATSESSVHVDLLSARDTKSRLINPDPGVIKL